MPGRFSAAHITTSSAVYCLRRRAVRVLMYVVLLSGVLISIVPLAWTVLTSFKTYGEHINRETWPDAWTLKPYLGAPAGGTYELVLQEPVSGWEGVPRTFSPLKEAIYTIDSREGLSPIIAKQLDQEIVKLLRRASKAREKADALLAQAAALPADQAAEIAQLRAEAAQYEAQAAAFENKSHIYPLNVLFLAVDSTNDDVVNYDSFVLTVDTRVKQQETAMLKMGEWGGPFYRYASGVERWGPHFKVSQAAQDSITIHKNWRAGEMLMYNYMEVWDEAGFARYIRNSLLITLTTVLGVVVFGVLAAYAFARMAFPGRDLVFSVYLATMMVPGLVTLIPNFLIVQELNDIFYEWLGIKDFWYDNLPPLVMPFLANTFGIFLMRQFFLQIPKELYDASLMDGCGHLRFLTQVVLPLSKAPLMSVAVFNAVSSWNAFLWPILVTSKPDWRPVTVGLSQFIDEAGAQMQLMMAGAVIAIVPILILYFLAQKQFTEGVAKEVMRCELSVALYEPGRTNMHPSP